MHRDALHAAAAAESVAAHAGPAAFWAMHNLLFEHQRDGTPTFFVNGERFDGD